MAKPIFFVDLDDTIFQTDRKLPPAEKGRASVAALDRQGRPLSFATARQAAFFSWLGDHAIPVPVTGRSVAALSRVLLPFHSWRIASHGAVILDAAGHPEANWARQMARELQPFVPRLLEMERALQAGEGLPGARCALVREDGLPVYLSCRQSQLQNQEEPDKMLEFLRQFDLSCMKIYAHGNNLAILPEVVGKERAVARVLELCGPIPFCVGLGDSLGDLPFLSLCDWWGTPSKSQIAEYVFANIPVNGQ